MGKFWTHSRSKHKIIHFPQTGIKKRFAIKLSFWINILYVNFKQLLLYDVRSGAMSGSQVQNINFYILCEKSFVLIENWKLYSISYFLFASAFYVSKIKYDFMNVSESSCFECECSLINFYNKLTDRLVVHFVLKTGFGFWRLFSNPRNYCLNHFKIYFCL